MTDLPITSPSRLSWDGEGRRVSGGPLAPDLALPEGEDSLSFGDVLSVFNPLQHIPVVSSLYRWVTGDTIKPAARVIGGAIFGGPVGLASGVFNAIVEQVKGADIGTLALAMFDGEPKSEGEAVEPKLAAASASEPATDRPASGPASTGADALAQLAADLRAIRDEPAKAEGPSEVAAAPAAATSAPASGQGQGRDIGYYLANAGRRIPATDLSKGRVVQAQPTASAVHVPAPVAAQLADEARKATDGSTAQDEPPSQWFNAAMMRGLDRYRAMQRGEAAPQVDLSH